MPKPTRSSGINGSGGVMSDSDRFGLYRAIFSRRDVRSQFAGDAIPHDVLSRILLAAHHAPSVGLMQPWNFIVIESEQRRRAVHELFQKANAEAAARFEGERGEKYRSMKLEGILDSPLNLCITCDHSRFGPEVLGRTQIKETDVYSTVCAIQNLWLAARTEGIGIGWVSILDPQELKQTLKLPDHVSPIAYLCMGYVTEFLDQPELQKNGWGNRVPLEEMIMFEHWQGGSQDHPLLDMAQTVRETWPGTLMGGDQKITRGTEDD